MEAAVKTPEAAQFAKKLTGAVDGAVVTRFPPEPSGYLHIGHAKAALLNKFYATYFHGKMLVRFDDTNPSKEKMEFESAILEDLKLLGIEVSEYTHTSDHFERLAEVCTDMLTKGLFYIDKTGVEEMRRQRGVGTESSSRANSVEENLRLWVEMKAGSTEGQECCVRAKIDMQAKNKCMRDPVMYRCVVDPPHHLHGDKYKVYPMYDFACPLVDSWEGVTHALRTNEYADRIPQYVWVQETAGVRQTTIYEFSRLNFVNTVLSKRKLQWLCDTNAVEGWDDPRFPTVRGIVRRGLSVESLLDFIIEQGPSKNQNLMEWDKLWSKNTKFLDPKSRRFMAVGSDACPVLVKNATNAVVQRQLHPKDAAIGTCPLIQGKHILVESEDAASFAEGEEITLMRWGNAFVDKIVKDAEGRITSLEATSHPEGSVKNTKKKVHWIIDSSKMMDSEECKSIDCLKPVVAGVLREYDMLITKKKPEEGDNFDDIVNRNSMFDTTILLEPEFAQVKRFEVVQLERRGYVRVDHFDEQGKPVLIKIPDGKTKAMSTLTTKVDAKSLTKGKQTDQHAA